ncbi:ATP-binding cassette domain-containing protein [Thermophagus xiamenensis]|uniref:ABC-type lipoprotein export system, ATPase component n=1 Tax=Thermophagus xiamenensis TaxID=385682 RepID=A0A1I1YJ20_9BACT|nr:ATP-binding cassette domain-containing protein [Thermophagus xiamenensis]SFE19614.1 ABC-type lipoprotein export system, ATPase component [Thermophagus xiamenensis]
MEQIRNIKIIGGIDKSGKHENIKCFDIAQGEIIGIVGPTGSGKSQLIADIEQLSQKDSSTRRQILINGEIPSSELRNNPRQKLVAQLSQNMNFLADMNVKDFLLLHAQCRGKSMKNIDKIIYMANQLTGEPIKPKDNLTILSGGQTRALMVADVAVISESPIVLIDEIENAGIKKHEALELLSGYNKIILIVTHDPVMALSAQKRIIMKNGGMTAVIDASPEEKTISSQLSKVDQTMLKLREMIRNGQHIEEKDINQIFLKPTVNNKMATLIHH